MPLLCISIALGVPVVFWRKKRNGISELRSVRLPGEVGCVSIPSDFVVEMEDDSTLMAYPQGEETITLRFSSISACWEGGDEHGGETFVKEKAAQDGLSCSVGLDKAILSYEEESDQDGVPLLTRFWDVGSRNTVVIISATIPKKKRRHRAVEVTLAAMPAILESLEVTKLHKTIESDGREVQAIIQTADPIPQSVQPFGCEEERWLEASLDKARELGLRYGSGGKLTQDELDRVFSRWMSEEGEKESSDLVANALGAAFGTYLVERHGFRWVLLTDAYGSEYAVRHPVGEVTAFPRASVEKRIQKGQPEFFQDLYLGILDQLQASRRERGQSQ